MFAFSNLSWSRSFYHQGHLRQEPSLQLLLYLSFSNRENWKSQLWEIRVIIAETNICKEMIYTYCKVIKQSYLFNFLSVPYWPRLTFSNFWSRWKKQRSIPNFYSNLLKNREWFTVKSEQGHQTLKAKMVSVSNICLSSWPRFKGVPVTKLKNSFFPTRRLNFCMVDPSPPPSLGGR